jgi:hypothetical protein
MRRRDFIQYFGGAVAASLPIHVCKGCGEKT